MKNSTLRLLIDALAMLGAFLIGASSTSGRWVPIGVIENAFSVYVLDSTTGEVCAVKHSFRDPPSLSRICTVEK